MQSVNWDKIKHVYFLGIGGIGMSGLARYFHSNGKKVSGYDKTISNITRDLELIGIEISYDDNAAILPGDIDCVVYTPAIPKTLGLYNHFLIQGILLMKRAEALGIISRKYKTIGVSGSHGKTTVSAMITHVLKSSGIECTAFLGGISVNYNSNYVHGMDEFVVIEADEYDRSFHQLNPSIAIVTAVDTDHLDIYGTKQNIEDAFLIFLQGLKDEKLIIAHNQVGILNRLSGQDVRTYSANDSSANLYAHSISFEAGEMKFNVIVDAKKELTIQLGIPGIHNVENALAALGVAIHLDLEIEKVIEAFKTFQGIKRRFELIYKGKDFVYYDDYAHHPEEIKAFLGSLKYMYSDKKICAIFQPHLFSRTQDLAAGFASSLSIADRVLVMDIYPARELPIEGVSSSLISNLMDPDKVTLVTHNSLMNVLQHENFDVLCTIGAGDIDLTIQPIKTWLTAKNS